MPFTIDQDKFLLEAYFRTGEKVAKTWMYDIRKCQSEFYLKYPDEEQIVYDVFAQYVRRLVSRFNKTGGVCKTVPKRKASKVTEELLKEFEVMLEEDPRRSIRQIAKITGISYGSCRKALGLIESFKNQDNQQNIVDTKETISSLRI
ncbi:uncharacterized protein [Onthophagus taurus]|uniref:uncharacterized protein n=1 Tax=Onthophagus taurus TaxID=166361 RepID=UPI000C206208|nr:uncharacterized protein LOC111420727 [Onthophagus taurus]